MAGIASMTTAGVHGVRGRRRWLQLAVVLGLSLGMLIVSAVSAVAAVAGVLSTSVAQPGASVVLSTDDQGNPYTYLDLALHAGPIYLVGAADYEKEIAKYGFQRCALPEQHYLGKLKWVGDLGTLSFKVPDVPTGEYYFELVVPYSSPECWRIGSSSGSGPVHLAVESKTMRTSPLAPAQSRGGMAPLAIGAIGVVVALAAAGSIFAVVRRLGQPPSHSSDSGLRLK